jgi:hypothetical protein
MSQKQTQDERISTFSPELQAKLEKLKEDYKREGPAAIHRFRDADPASYLLIVAALDPRAALGMLEEFFVYMGMTDADIRTMVAKNKQKN